MQANIGYSLQHSETAPVTLYRSLYLLYLVSLNVRQMNVRFYNFKFVTNLTELL